MNINLEMKVLSFQNTYFSKEAQRAIDNRAYILDYCVKTKAWNDTVMRERYNNESQVIRNKDAIVALIKSELVANAEFICADFDNWHNTMCKKKGFRNEIWIMAKTYQYDI